jgi:hypothetical protein
MPLLGIDTNSPWINVKLRDRRNFIHVCKMKPVQTPSTIINSCRSHHVSLLRDFHRHTGTRTACITCAGALFQPPWLGSMARGTTRHATEQRRRKEEQKKIRGSRMPVATLLGTAVYLHVRHRSAHWLKSTAQLLMHGCISQRWRLMASNFSFLDSGTGMKSCTVGGKHQTTRRPSPASPTLLRSRATFANTVRMEPFGTPAVNAHSQLFEAVAFVPPVPGQAPMILNAEPPRCRAQDGAGIDFDFALASRWSEQRPIGPPS